MVRVADYIINKITEIGIDHIFMVTGRGVLYLSDAIAKSNEMEAVCVHHEQAAAYAAYAYAQVNNNMGACLVSTGCASTNAITGVLCAWQDAVPCIVISGQNMSHETTYVTGLPIRTYGNQEANIVSIVQSITKYAVTLTQPDRVVYELEKAIYYALEGKKGPVWVDVPLDIQNARVDVECLEHYNVIADNEPVLDKRDVIDIWNSLSIAKRPVLLAGDGIRAAGAVEQLKVFLQHNPIPLVVDNSAVDLLDESYALFLGQIGSLGANRAANFALQNADFLLVIGSSLSTVTTGDDYGKFARAAQIVVVDNDKEEHKKNTINIDRFLHANIRDFLMEINKNRIPENSQKDWHEKCLHWKSLFPKCEHRYLEMDQIDMYFIANVLSEVLDEDAVFLCDAGFEELIFPSTIRFDNKRRCIHPVSQGAMGFALPASLGARIAGKRQTVAVIGDGSIMMNLQELQTVLFNNADIKIIIINNNCYSVIRKRQTDLFRNRTIGTDVSNGVNCPNFQKIADAFGFPYVKIEDKRDVKATLEYLLASEGAAVCEILCTENQEYIHNSYGKNESGQIIKRSLEDQSPFLDRKLLRQEMIVDYLG